MRSDDWEPRLDDAEVRAYIQDEVGPDGLEMAAYLQKAQPVKGEDILEHYKERKPSEVRKVLYAMMEAHCAEYERDTDGKGWETFVWRLDLMEIKYILRRRWADELLHVKQQLRFERDHQFYACTDQHRRMVFEDAIDVQFQCPVCHARMDLVRTPAVQRALQERLEQLAPYFDAA